MSMRYDLVISGAGPAGCAAAVVARGHGLSVALIDKASFPRDKLCGGLITGRSKKLLANIFNLGLDPKVFLANRTFRLTRQGAEISTKKLKQPLHSTMRWDFDEMLYQKALSAGAQLLTDQILQINEVESLVDLKSGQRLSYGVLLGADGVNSVVARHLFGRAFNPKTIGFGLETEAPAGAENTSIIVDIGATHWGYGWAFPKHGSTTIGVGGLK